jgi:small glutamine-rich tetratricopeptide repeat-containing protein alpha
MYRYAHFALGQYEEAKDAFERGLALEPNNQAMKTALENAKSQLGPDAPPVPPSRTPPTEAVGSGASMPNLEEMMRNVGGGGGMPDMAGMMNNPMMRQMVSGGWRCRP